MDTPLTYRIKFCKNAKECTMSPKICSFNCEQYQALTDIRKNSEEHKSKAKG